MFIGTARTGVLKALAAALATGCTTVVSPTSPAELPQGRSGYVIGYLEPMELPDSQALLAPPPAAGSAGFAADEATDYYKRRPPFAVYGDTNCAPREQLKDDAYPSRHSSIAWAWAVMLADEVIQ